MTSRKSYSETIFLQLHWKSVIPPPDFFYSYVGKSDFSTVTMEITMVEL